MPIKSLIKTEVVLKWHGYKVATVHKKFNKNRSCIEICFVSDQVYQHTRLIKTEVVLK